MSAVVNHLWQSTLFALAAALLAWALRNNSAAVRYRVWLAASLKFLLPFSLLIALGSRGHLPGPVRPEITSAVQQMSRPFVPAAEVFDISPEHASASPVSLQSILLAIWFMGCGAVLLRWFLNWRSLRTVVKTARQLSLETSLPVMTAASALEPGVFGIWKPVLLLPDGITGHLTPQQLESVIAHELCHVRRRDNLAAAAHMVIQAFFWFHPLVWWIGARLVEERERACDEDVLRLGNQRAVYAESILKVCQFYLESPLVCVAGVTGSDLKQRVVRIMTGRMSARLNAGQKILLAGMSAVAIALPLTVGLMKAGQGQPLPSFDVASVKRDGPVDPQNENSDWDDAPGTLTATGISLNAVIENAYHIRSYQLDAPGWLKSERYDIAARWPATRPNSDFPLMLQSLLSERFKLVLHHEERQLPVLELRVARNGPKLQATKFPGDHSSTSSHQIGHVSAQNLNAEQIAGMLSTAAGRPVLDKTGLSGRFDFELQFTPNDAPESDASGPSIFTAVQEQLGLKLVPAKGPVDILVVDHLEKVPTEN
jgi:uncharacterized protein (TIGR03435 family)